MKEKKYRLLLLEDDYEDAILFKDHLVESGINCEVTLVNEYNEYLRLLNRKRYDAIVCDNGLPKIELSEALKTARKLQPKAPFIVLSGSVTEEQTSQALKAGADEVVRKGDYYRLVPAIERQLKAARLKNSKLKIKKQLDKKDAFLQLIAENIEYTLGLISRDGRIIYFSPSFEKLSGYQPHEVIGNDFFDFIEPSDAKRIRRIISPIIKLNLQRTYRVNGNFIRKNGEFVQVESRIRTIGNGKATKFAVILKDKSKEQNYLSKLKSTEKQFQMISSELQHIIDHSNSPFFGVDWDGKINEWNPACSKITGYSRNEVLGRSILDIIVPTNSHLKVLQLFEEALNDNKSYNLELECISKDKTPKVLLFNATPRRDPTGKVIGALCHGQDITLLSNSRDLLEREVEKRTLQLQKSLKKEKELSNMKMKFISMASHEFRTPLSTMKFAASFIKRYYDRSTKEMVYQRLVKIEEQIDAMTYLLDDVLLMGKNEQIHIKPILLEISISQFFHTLKEEIEQQYNSHTINIHIEASDDTILMDRQLLKNIISNLLSNAIKYSPNANGVMCHVQKNHRQLIIKVKDWGMGVSEEDQKRIFEPFFRTEGTSHISGTGLGLSIVSRAVDSLDGKIEINSSEGQGTEFIIYLPLYEK